MALRAPGPLQLVPEAQGDHRPTLPGDRRAPDGPGALTTRREVDPYHLRYVGGALYLYGYDHLRRDVRTFAVERIRSLTVTDHAYQLPLGFDIDEYVGDALVVMQGRPVAVELRFDKPTAAWVRDRLWHPSQRLEPLPGGRLRMTLRVADTRELLGWILQFGAGVAVVRPDTLRQKVAAEARGILQHEVT